MKNVKSPEIQYNKLRVFYFSGTGNAKMASEWIAEKALELKIPAEIINIAEIKDVGELQPFGEKTLLGFCFPTHGFNAPPIVLRFLYRFNRGNSDVFLLNTRAGLKLSKIFLPGIGGLALWIPAVILLLKGYKTVGFRPLDLPSNWISLHPGVKKKVANSIYSRCKGTIYSFSKTILNGNRINNGFYWLPLDILVSPIAFGYYFYGRFIIAKTFFANYNCKQCGICIRQCPVKAIKSIDNRPYWGFSCESCMKCMNSCPNRAIETAHLFTFFLWWLIFSILPFLLTSFASKIPAFRIFFNKFGYEGVFNFNLYVFGIITVFFAYMILHYTLRFKIINWLITKTSLTHYKFWRRYFVPSNSKI